MPAEYHPPNPPATPSGIIRIRHVSAQFTRLELPPKEVHLWVIANADSPSDNALTPAEAARAERYSHPRAREQFVRARGWLRQLLGAYLECEPQTVPLTVAPDGKPELDLPGPPLHFNVSHTDGLALVAIARVPVGVDCERWRVMASADDLVSRYFNSREESQFRALPETLRPAAFLRGWVCKEAVLKGVGCGSRGLEQCAVDLDPTHPARVLSLEGTAAKLGTAWHLVAGSLPSGHLVALAVPGNESWIVDASPELGWTCGEHG